MSLPDAVLRSAIEVVLLWGPERAVPEPDRLLVLHPSLSPEEVTEALQTAHCVTSDAEEMAPALKQGLSGGVQSLRDRYPWLTSDQASQALNQGMYYHWRESGE